MQYEEKDIKNVLFGLIAITSAFKIFIAATLELSVDEVYYWTYALYPDWSHFDHPPMVGFIIQLFSLNLLFDSELALRLGSIVISGLNTLVIYSIGKTIKNPLTGLYAALLLNASIYASVLAGNFIIPDTPQLLFWLLSLKYIIKSLPKTEIDKSIRSYIWTLPNIQTNLAKIKVIQVNLEYDHISDQSEEFTIASVTSAVDESLNINNFKLYFS